MGLVYGIHSLSPTVIREIGSLSSDEMLQRLQAQGVPKADVGAEDGTDIDENAALMLLATTREWDIDKSRDDVERLMTLAPALTPVKTLMREMEDFQASGVAARFQPREVGLMGIAMPPTIAAALTAARPFAGAGGRQKFEETPFTGIRRLFWGGLRRRLLTDDYVWENWNRFVEAMEWADQRGEWLGLAMS